MPSELPKTIEILLNRFDNKVMLSVEDISRVTGWSQQTIRNRITNKTFPIPTSSDGRRRFATINDVAIYIDRISAPKKRRGPRTAAEKIAAAKQEANHA